VGEGGEVGTNKQTNILVLLAVGGLDLPNQNVAQPLAISIPLIWLAAEGLQTNSITQPSAQVNIVKG